MFRNKTRRIFVDHCHNYISKRNQSSSIYCMESLKKHEYENFICTLLLKNKARLIAFAVRSFNIEISNIVAQKKHPNLALMRLKFWEETVEKCFTKDLRRVPQHPVASEMYKAIVSADLSKCYFDSLIKCRFETINTTIFNSLHDMENYSEQSVSNIYYLLLEGSDVKSDKAKQIALHLGKAQGLVQQLRSIPLANQLNFVSVSKDLLHKYSISEGTVLKGRFNENLNTCVKEIANIANHNLSQARYLINDVPKMGRAVLLPASAVENYLNRLKIVNYNVLDPKLLQRSWFWIPKVWFNSLINKY